MISSTVGSEFVLEEDLAAGFGRTRVRVRRGFNTTRSSCDISAAAPPLADRFDFLGTGSLNNDS
jgi:hypothetical protein